MELFKLFGTIAVNNSEANANIDETSEKAEGFGSKLAKGMGTVAKWGAGILTAATGATAAMTKFATSAASTADNIDKMSQKIGISRDAYQELDFICSQSGTSVDNLQTGMKSLVSAMDGAASGTESNIAAFEKLGVAVTNADGTLRSSEDVMWETMAALQSMDNETEKARLATELFGRSGTELMPLLNGATGSIDEMREQAHELGLVLDDETIDAGVSLTDTMDQMKRSIAAVGTKLGASLMPILEKVCNMIINAMPIIQGLVEDLEPIITAAFEGLLPPLLELAENLFPVILGLIETILPILTEIVQSVVPILIDVLSQLMPIIMEVVQAVLPVILQLIQTLLPPLQQIIEALLPVLVAIVQALLPIFQTVIDIVTPILNLIIALVTPIANLIASIAPLITILGTLINDVLKAFQPILDVLIETIGAVLTPIIEALSPIFEAITTALQPLFDLFSLLLSTVLEPILPVFEALSEVLSGALFTAIESVMGVLDPLFEIFNGLIEFITGVFTGNWKKAWNGIVDIFKGIINLIPSAVEGIINGAIGLINGIIKGVNKITGKLGIPKIPTIPEVTLPKLEEGGVLEQGQVGLLEGNGAEAVVPLEKNHAWISRVADDMQNQGIGGGDSETTGILRDILSLLHEIKDNNDNLPEVLVDAMANGLVFSLNNREFARMVKAVN